MKPIYIVGFMGAGKTSLGKKIAHQLGLHFIDLDHAIEMKAGKSIQQIFSQEGESSFRALESLVLKEVSKSETVISCGGGTPCFNDNLDYMFEEGIIVYLKMEPGMLVNRLQTNRAKRPLVAALTDDEVVEFVYNKLKERELYYINAHIIFYPMREKLESLLEIISNNYAD